MAIFSGTAITLGAEGSGTGDNAEVRDTTIIGFNTGIYSQGNSDIKLTNVIDDSTRCFDIQKEDQGVATVNGLYCYPEMTRQVMSGGQNAGLVNLFASNISANISGGYTVTLCSASPCTACVTGQNCPLTNDTAWITDPVGAESAEGRWTLMNCTGSPTTSCDLQGSQASSAALPLSGTGTFAKGVTQIAITPASYATVNAVSPGAGFGYENQNHLIELTIPSGASYPAAGQIVSVSGMTSNDSPEANGVWIVASESGTTCPCTVDLQNSVFVNGATGLSAKIEWGYPSVGQNVSGTGIAVGTTVAIVWPAEDTAFVSQPTSAAGTGSALSYYDNPFGFGGTISGVVASGGSSPCPGYSANDLCITVANTTDLVSGHSDVAVQNVVMSDGTPVNNVWTNVNVVDATHLDLPYSSNMGNCATTPCFVSGDSYVSGGSFISGYLRLDVNQRAGDSVYVSNSNNVALVNFQTFEHYCGLHFGTGADWARAVNVEIDQDVNLEDADFCGAKFDSNAKGNVVVNGAIDIAGGSILSDTTATNSKLDTNMVENIRLGGTSGSALVRTLFEVDGNGANLALANDASQAPGYGLISGGINHLALTGNLLPNVNVYYQSSGSAQSGTTGILNSFSAGNPNMTTMGSCAAGTNLALPLAMCGFLGLPVGTYSASPVPTATSAVIDDVNVIGSSGDAVAFADASDGSGKCHWVIADAGATKNLTIYGQTGSSDKINGVTSFVLTGSKMGIFCSYKAGNWWGGALN